MIETARNILSAAFRAFTPRARSYLLQWCETNIVTDRGRPYDHAAYPHLGAPGGPCDAWDNPRVRETVLQWATRLGKTFFGQCTTLHTLDTDPAPQMFCSASEKLAKEVTERTYDMIRGRRELAALLIKPEKMQRQDCIETAGGKVYIAWARSPATLADKNIKRGHANEVDKYEHASTAKEADPLKLFSDRFKDYQSVRKILIESTPTVAGRSRIETARLTGSNRSLHVPCPHCKRFQKLEFKRVKWEKDDPFKTAHYQCHHCDGKIENHQRPWSIRRGVWVPAGAKVRDREAMEIADLAVKGDRVSETTWRVEPWHDGPTDWECESFQLSSLYALSLRWGDIAVEFISCKGKPQLLRNFVNQWLGETWELKRGKSTVEQIAERSQGSHHRGDVPAGAAFLIATADQQAADGGFVKWMITAHRFDPTGDEFTWLIDYGFAANLKEFWDSVVCRDYRMGTTIMRPRLTGVDSGYKTKATYDFCARHPRCLPLKGSSGDLGGAPFKIAKVDGAATLVHVNTDYWETDLQNRLDTGIAGNPGAFTLPVEASRDVDFLNELTNAVLDDVTDARGVVRLRWVKRDEHKPNDFRDTPRYALCLASMIHRATLSPKPPTRESEPDRGHVREASWT